MDFIRIKNRIISLDYVKAITIGEGMVVIDDGSRFPLVFAVPEAGTTPALLEKQGRRGVIVPVSDEDLATLIDRLLNHFPVWIN